MTRLLVVPQCGIALLPADRTARAPSVLRGRDRRGGGPLLPGGSFLEVHACGPPDVMA